MALQTYRVEDFKGIDQSRSENKLNSGYSPDAVNMDTANGDLAVGYGYSKHITTPVPGTGTIRRMYHWHTLRADKFIVIAGNTVYAYNGSTWETIHTYTEEITSNAWDFEEVRIGTTDYLIVANGQTQMIKWDGEGEAELFGTGEYVFETTVASVGYNGTKATAVEYAEEESVGTFTLTMPSGWVYAENTVVAFTVPQDMGNVKTVKLAIGSNTYTMDFVPIWSSGDTAAAVLLTATNATEYEEAYGVNSVTLASDVPPEWIDRTVAVGIQIDGITQAVAEVDGATVKFAKVATREIKSGMTAKVRGGLSNIPVNYVELYYSRLFSAGDPEHPSRLYWSQPPGDTRTIEDWSMDDASDLTGGGFVEIGQTSSDPIVGLCALSNQLIIFKQSSIYRLLGDRPANYRITSVNKDVERMVNTALVAYGDIPYWLTRGGLYYHDGQSANLSASARQIRDILADADLSTCKGAENRDRLYFTIRQHGGAYDDAIIVYDMKERTYMLRNGFAVVDIAAYEGTLYMINDQRYVYQWDKSTTYDGEQIHAHWNTPFTDAGAMSVTKKLTTLYLRGEGEAVRIRYRIGPFSRDDVYHMQPDTGEVLRVPLQNEGRVFGLEISNEAGSHFRILGGMDLRFMMIEDGN